MVPTQGAGARQARRGKGENATHPQIGGEVGNRHQSLSCPTIPAQSPRPDHGRPTIPSHTDVLRRGPDVGLLDFLDFLDFLVFLVFLEFPSFPRIS